MTRLELIISTILLIAFIVFVRWVLNDIGETWGLGALWLAVALIAAIVLPACYVYERRRGNLPRWLQPRAKHPPPRG